MMRASTRVVYDSASHRPWLTPLIEWIPLGESLGNLCSVDHDKCLLYMGSIV